MKSVFRCLILALAIGSVTATQAEVSVMSFNLRIATAPDGDNDWSHRRAGCVSAIASIGPDLMGVQENISEMNDYLRANLNDTYACVITTSTNPDPAVDAIYYRKDRFELLRHSFFYLSPTPNTPSLGWDGQYPRVAQYVVLSDKQDGDTLCFVNTHLDHVGVVARREGLRLIADSIRALEARYGTDLPTFLTGDFNTTPDDTNLAPIRAMMTSTQEHFGNDHITFHSFGDTTTKGVTIDYIFYRHALPMEFRVITEGYGIPYLSDHYPILGRFRSDLPKTVPATSFGLRP